VLPLENWGIYVFYMMEEIEGRDRCVMTHEYASIILCRGADLGGDRGGRSPPILNVGGTESLISPPIYHEYNKKCTFPPNSGSGGDWGDGGSTESLRENFHLHPPPPPRSRVLPREEEPFPPNSETWGGRFNFFPDLSPPNP